MASAMLNLISVPFMSRCELRLGFECHWCVSSNSRGELKGRITVHSSLGIGRKHIAPLLGEFVRQHPLIQIDLELSPLPLNISGTNFDIAIRVGGLSDSRLKAKLLARNRRIVCAAPSYFDSAPPLQTIRDLERHNCIVLRENNGDYSL